MVSENIQIPDRIIEHFCRKWRITELSLFGSVLGEDFRPTSDIDVMVTFAPGAEWSFFQKIVMEDELSSIVGRPVDLVERRAIERSENYLRRRHILSTAESIYVARP